MTLLLNLVGPSGIYQSSDYRLTDVSHGRTIEDAFGGKQLSFTSPTWRAYISFTGTAEIGGRKTRDWILDTLEKLQHPITGKEAIGKIAERGTDEFKRVPREHRILTIAATLDEGSGPARFFVISCNEIPGQPRPAQPFDGFRIYEFSSRKPNAIILGFIDCVSKADKKLLRNLTSSNLSRAEIRKALAKINARSAKRSKGLVSEGCLVSAILSNGKRLSENFGRVPGIPAGMPLSAEAMQAAAPANPSARPVYIGSVGAQPRGSPDIVIGPMEMEIQDGFIGVQIGAQQRVLFLGDSAGNTYTERPDPRIQETDESQWYKRGLPIGEERKFELQSAHAATMFNGPDGTPMAEVVIQAFAGSLPLRKNQILRAVLNRITVRLNSSFKYSGDPLGSPFEMPAIFEIGGAKPRSWTYTVDVRVYSERCEFSLRRISVTLRRGNCQSPLLVLADTEEIAILAPRAEVNLSVTPDSPSASSNIEARFLLRDILQPTA